MHRRVEGERQAEGAHPAGNLELAVVRVGIVGDAVGVGGLRVLDRHLHVVEAEHGQPLQPLARQQHAGGDQVGVEPDLGRLRHDLLEVAAHGGLAARQMQLQDAEIGRLRQHVEPYLGRQLARRRARAPADWSSRGTAAGSGASARRAARSGPAPRPQRRELERIALMPSPRPCRRGPAAWGRCRRGCAPPAPCRPAPARRR